MELALIGITGLLLGGIVGWTWSARVERARAATETAAQGDALRNAFSALAADALRQNAEQLERLANTRMESATRMVRDDGEKRELALKALVEPLQKSLDRVQAETRGLEQVRTVAYADLKQRLDALSQSTLNLDQHSRSFTSLLKGSAQARGRWGEMVLRNVAELADMLEHCDFELQQSVGGGRPDMTVRLPGGAAIAVDSKVPLEAYAQASEAADAAVQAECLKRHANSLKLHIKALKDRDYPTEMKSPVNLTVLFVPADAILSAAFQQDPEIQSFALKQRVLIATPVTLVALLRTVGLYWQQHRTEANARVLGEACAELHKRLTKFTEHLTNINKGLTSAVTAYNDAVGSYETRLLSKGREIEGLLAAPATAARLPSAMTAIEELPRQPRREE